MPPDSDFFQFPQRVMIDAYSGDGPSGASAAVHARAGAWGLSGRVPRVTRILAPPAPAEPANWKDPRVGWGLVLAEKTGLTQEQLASGSDAPEPIVQLLRERPGSPVLRYRPNWQHQFGLLRNYRDGVDVNITGSAPGVAAGGLPRYLLIYGGPDEVPWELQFLLNAVACAGRLTLTGAALERYIAALCSGWKDSAAASRASTVWAVNHGAEDITHLMRNVIAAPVHDKHKSDRDMTTVFLDGDGQATGANLIESLKQTRPGVIVTTSHGKTGPIGRDEEMAAQLGVPVDQNFQTLDTSELFRRWHPDGAIWYAHACCSAGSAAGNHFKGLTGAGSEVERVLDGVAALGDRVAPLPVEFLGAAKPGRAFIGHVEPTFDWTLSDPRNHQPLTHAITTALYDQLYQPKPVGLAFREQFARIGGLLAAHLANVQKFNSGDTNDAAIVFYQLTARDVRSMVILGDPTAMLPPL